MRFNLSVILLGCGMMCCVLGVYRLEAQCHPHELCCPKPGAGACTVFIQLSQQGVPQLQIDSSSPEKLQKKLTIVANQNQLLLWKLRDTNTPSTKQDRFTIIFDAQNAPFKYGGTFQADADHDADGDNIDAAMDSTYKYDYYLIVWLKNKKHFYDPKVVVRDTSLYWNQTQHSPAHRRRMGGAPQK